MCFVLLNDRDCWQIASYDLVFIPGLHITIRCWILKICLVLIVEGWERGRCKTNTTHLSSIQRLLRGQAHMMLPISRCYCWQLFRCLKVLILLQMYSCFAELTIKTNPQNFNYIVKSGATIIFEPVWKGWGKIK